MLCPFHFLIHVYPPTIFARDLLVVPVGWMLACSLRNIYGRLGGRTRFIYKNITRWADIRWEGEMLNGMSEVNLGFGHFRCD